MSTTISNCRRGELVVQAPQSEIDKMLREAERSGVKVERTYNGGPAGGGIGLPVYNEEFWSGKATEQNSSEQKQPVTVNNQQRKDGPAGGPLGLPRYDF